MKETTWNCRIKIILRIFDTLWPSQARLLHESVGFYKKSCHCKGDMVVRMRKVMAMKRSLHVCFSAGNWYCYKVAAIAKKFTWSWDCYKIRLSADNFKTPTQPRWARPTSSPGLFPQKMGGAPPNFWGKSPGDDVGARHGCAILVFGLQTPARKCEIINCLPVWWGRIGWVDEPYVRSRDYQKFLGWSDNQLFSAITLCSRVELRYQSLTTMYYLSAQFSNSNLSCSHERLRNFIILYFVFCVAWS